MDDELSFIKNNNNYYGDNDSVRSMIMMCIGILKDVKQLPILMQAMDHITKFVRNILIEFRFFK